jgi:hypothetical protein
LSPRTDRGRRLRVAAASALALLAASCTEYLERRETIALHAGNAVAANRAIHTVDPWPAASARTDIETSGRRVVDAIERYEAGKPPNGSAPAPTIMAIPRGMPGGAPAAQ